jgi:hypothetical protein
MSRSIYHYEVGLDDPEVINLTGPPLAFGVLERSKGMEFWAEHDDAEAEIGHTFIIIGTGHLVPRDARYVGTAPRTPEGYVWHLYELP